MAEQTTARAHGAEADRPHVLVILGGKVSTHALPETGALVLGRGAESDIRIDHPSISRRHARLMIDGGVTLEDLGSANGTRFRDAPVVPGAAVVIERGEVIEVGAAVVIVQAGFERRRAHRLWAHGYFEARLEDECARAEVTGASLAILRLSCKGDRPPGLIEERIASSLRDGDVLGVYAPGEYEVLAPDTDPAAADELGRALVAALQRIQIAARAGVVCRPRDGRAPHVLFAAACAAVREPGGVIGKTAPVIVSAAMRRLYQVVERVAAGDLTVLIRGETGVGKELIADALHRRSPRADGPMLRLNLGAIPESLIESELFGHERGAFTGAVTARPGALETAHRGTVFLDEVAELPPKTQAKLLRVLEDRQVTRIGSVKPRVIDVRFVAATHRDLEAEVARGTFREDLYYRLSGVTLFVPPLRDRVDEIEPLARAFARDAATRADRPTPELDRDAIGLLERYPWPGNVRELRNAIERAVVLSGDRIERDQLPIEKLATPTVSTTAPTTAPPLGKTLRKDLADVERQHILDALSRCGGNQTEAAKLLGISRRTLSTKLDRLAITRPRKH